MKRTLNIMLALAVCFCAGVGLYGWYLQEGTAGSELEGSEPAEAAPAATSTDEPATAAGSPEVYWLSWLDEPAKRVLTDHGVRREAEWVMSQLPGWLAEAHPCDGLWFNHRMATLRARLAGAELDIQKFQITSLAVDDPDPENRAAWTVNLVISGRIDGSPVELWVDRPTLGGKPYGISIRSSDKQTAARMNMGEAIAEFARAYGEGLVIGSKIRSGRIFSNRESEAAEIPTPAINAR